MSWRLIRGWLGQEAHLQTVIEVLQSIKASDMTPMLQRIYGTPGERVLDVLMKYLYAHISLVLFSTSPGTRANGILDSYKGMASTSSGGGSAPRTPTRMTPQQMGFSQVSGAQHRPSRPVLR